MNKKPIPVTPQIKSDRLILRSFTENDLDDAFELWSSPETNRYINATAISKESAWRKILSHLGSWAYFGLGYWVIEEIGSKDFVGIIGFSNYKRDLETSVKNFPEMGWILTPNKQGKGFATEAAKEALNWFSLNFQKQICYCIIQDLNTPSIKLAKSIGFKFLGTETYKKSKVHIYLNTIK